MIPTIADVIERHRAAQAAIDAADGPEGYPGHLDEAELDAFGELAETPCANDAEFLEKLRYLLAHETRIFGEPDGRAEFGPIVVAVDRHINPPSERKTSRAVIARTIIDGTTY